MKIFSRILLILLGLLLLVWLLIQTPPVQNFLAQQAAQKLSDKIGAEVKVTRVDFSLLNSMNLDGILVRDKQKDTLLYAGTFKVRITDWFIFKKKADLTYIGMEDVVVKMQRSDSAWNFQFIADAFASKDSATKQKSDSSGLALNIKKLDLKNVSFIKNDLWYGQKMQVKAGSLLLEADTIDIKNKNFIIRSLDLDKPFFSIENFTGKVPVPYTPYDSGYYFNKAGIKIKLASLIINDGHFGTSREDAETLAGKFEGRNIQVNKITGSLANVSFYKDTIKAVVKLKASERSGLEVKKLDADFRLTPQIMEFANLSLQTNNSTLGNYYAMHFRDFNEDMADYTNSVIMDLHMKGTSVNTDDVTFFAPPLKTWKREFKADGKFYGTVGDFTVKGLAFNDGTGTIVKGNLAMKGLPDTKKTTINLTGADVSTNSKDLAFVVPAIRDLKNPNLAALGNFNFKGDFSGDLHNYNAKGLLSTAIGNLTTDIALSFPANGEPTYKGTVSTPQFDLGSFINVKDIGNISFNGNVDGYSFKIDKIKTTVNGTLADISFKGYNYHNLSFNGDIAKKKVSGFFKADDPNFNFTSNIEIDLSQKQPVYNILGDLVFAHLKELNLANDKVDVTGLFDLNFQGNNIDDFLGYAKILNASIKHNGQDIDFDSLSVTAAADTGNHKILSLVSNGFDATVRGKYSILSLPNSFQAFLNHYYPAYIKPPKTIPANQNFSVNINTGLFEDYAHIIDSNLTGLNYASLTGRINTSTQQQFSLFASVPQAKYKRFAIEDAVITGEGNNDTLALDGDIGRFYIGDSLYFPNSKLNIKSSYDHSVVQLSTRTNNKLNDARLNADVFTLDDGVRINFRPSSFVINEKTWNLEEQGEVVIRKNYTSATNMKFTQGLQEISLETKQSEGGTSDILVARLKDLNLGDFAPLFVKKPLLEGVANGEIQLRDFYGKFKVNAKLDATQFRMDDDSIGLVHINAGYNKETGKVDFSVKSDNDKYVFNIDGYYNGSDSTDIPLNSKIVLKNTKIDLLNQFLSNIFSDISGLATGTISVEGNPKAPDLIGKVKLYNGGITVNYTKVHYSIDSAEINLTKDGIDFGQFTIKDKYGNTGTVRGKLMEHWFNNMRFDFDMKTNKMLLLDTKETDNTSFYGKATGRASMSIKGPQENMQVNITGESTDSSHIYIPTSNSRESAEADFIHFKQYGTEIQAPKSTSTTKLNINLDLMATNLAQIDVILDKLTGDQISARGNGRLIINVPANGSMTMNGRYNIESGKYDFNFQSLVKKPFVLMPDAGSYIQWNGDPYNADIKVDAKYTAQRVSLSDLLANTNLNFGGDVQAYKDDVYIIAELTGKLTSPDIDFRIEFPQSSPVNNNATFKQFIQSLSGDDNEMLKQVTWLIVFDAFAPYKEALTNNPNFVTSTGINTISQKILSEFNKIFSDFFFKLTGDRSWNFDFGTKTYSSSSLYTNSGSSAGALDRQSVNLKINNSLLNNKVIITFGGDLDFNVGTSTAATSGNFQWLPDISIQIVLSKDRNLRAIIFNRSSLDISSSSGALGRRTRQGASISFSRDSDGKKKRTGTD